MAQRILRRGVEVDMTALDFAALGMAALGMTALDMAAIAPLPDQAEKAGTRPMGARNAAGDL